MSSPKKKFPSYGEMEDKVLEIANQCLESSRSHWVAMLRAKLDEFIAEKIERW